MASLNRDVAAYEKWLRKHCDVVQAGLDAKGERMRESAFVFLRATYFRWARTIESVCPELADAPRVTCVGDIHLENFGTWRDADSRLVWGVNDFDEAAVMPYAYDLVRLAVSARLAPRLTVGPERAAAAILAGYRKGLAKPRSVLLDEVAQWLRPFVDGDQKANRKFWREVDGDPEARPPPDARRALQKSLPAGAEIVRFSSRQKGGGGLGRPRYLVMANWNSGRVVREAKALVPSAWDWAHGKKHRRSRLLELAYGGHRSPDPQLHTAAGYIIRRIAPDSRKVEIKEVERQGLSPRLLVAMGADLGAIHAADPRAWRIAEDLEQREPKWLQRAAHAAQEMTNVDFASWS
jgi:uncharacterized protein (DUF2252 family)